MTFTDFIIAQTAHFFAPFLSLMHSRISYLIDRGIICDHFVPMHRECIECLMMEEYRGEFEREVIRSLDAFFYGQ